MEMKETPKVEIIRALYVQPYAYQRHPQNIG